MMAIFISNLYHTFIVQPLRRLYLFGPSFMQFGFWGGIDQSEICKSVTTYSENFWILNSFQCDDIIEKKFVAFRVSVEIILYFFILYKVARQVNNLFWYICIKYLRPRSERVIYLKYPEMKGHAPIEQTILSGDTAFPPVPKYLRSE